MPAVFDRRYVKRLDGPHVKKGKNKRALAEALREDIRKFKSDNNCDRLVLIWCGSTEGYLTETEAHASVKTIVAPGLKARLLGVDGWYSTNILGNRDGEVLDDPESFKTKEESKKSVLDYILQPNLYPDLYGHIDHVVRINYYPPRGDNKEGWDNTDIFGWLNYKMQLKVDFLCRDSILAAPIVLDSALFLDLAKRAGMSGIQEWLSFYFKSPQHAKDLYPEHDLFIQLMKLKNTLRYLRGEELITHLGLEYYD